MIRVPIIVQLLGRIGDDKGDMLTGRAGDSDCKYCIAWNMTEKYMFYNICAKHASDMVFTYSENYNMYI